MIQPYGVHLTGDLGDLALIAVTYMLLYCKSLPIARVWLLASAAASLIGSVGVLGSAMSRGDAGVAIYHLGWVLGSAAVARWALQSLRDRRREQLGHPVYRGRRVPESVVREALGPNWDRVIGVDGRGNPVYQTRT